MNQNHSLNELAEKIIKLAEVAVAQIGLLNTAYIKPLTGERCGYSLNAADGKEIGVFASWDEAYYAAKQNELNPVSVH